MSKKGIKNPWCLFALRHEKTPFASADEIREYAVEIEPEVVKMASALFGCACEETHLEYFRQAVRTLLAMVSNEIGWFVYFEKAPAHIRDEFAQWSKRWQKYAIISHRCHERTDCFICYCDEHAHR